MLQFIKTRPRNIRWVAIAIVLVLAGCASLDTQTGGYLASSPRPGICSAQRCQQLDAFEAQGYALARQKQTTWVQFVDAFYQKRAELFPNGNDDKHGVHEIRTYQRMLAAQMDAGQLTEIQWAYLLKKKSADIRARGQTPCHSTARPANCTASAVLAPVQ